MKLYLELQDVTGLLLLKQKPMTGLYADLFVKTCLTFSNHILTRSPQGSGIQIAHCELINTAFLDFLVSGVEYEYLEGRAVFHMIQALCSSISAHAVVQ